jgi:hypothetical protein
MLPQKSPFLGDSLEAQRNDHLEKIRLLENELSRLNILEHPREIRDICNDIINIRKSLERISSAIDKK